MTGLPSNSRSERVWFGVTYRVKSGATLPDGKILFRLTPESAPTMVAKLFLKELIRYKNEIGQKLDLNLQKRDLTPEIDTTIFGELIDLT